MQATYVSTKTPRDLASQALPTVSVIIPAFNASDTLAAAIESVLRQKNVSTEIIVIDDSSTDSTPLILDFYAENIQFKRIPNSGPAAARNAGALMARAPWIAFLDADDEWEPNKLYAQLELATATDTSVIYTNTRNVGEDLSVDEIRLQSCPSGDVFQQLLQDNFVTLSGLMMSRRMFFDVGCFDEEIIGCEDWDLLLRLAANYRFAAVDEPLVRYRWLPDSLSSNHRKMHTARMATISKALNSTRGKALSASESRKVWARLWGASAWTASFSSRIDARICALRSLLWWPSLESFKRLLAP